MGGASAAVSSAIFESAVQRRPSVYILTVYRTVLTVLTDRDCGHARSAGTSDRPGRSQLSRCMHLPEPHGQPFREIFVLDKALGCMQDLIGNGFKGTEGRILMQQEGGEGHALHGGGTTRSAGEDLRCAMPV